MKHSSLLLKPFTTMPRNLFYQKPNSGIYTMANSQGECVGFAHAWVKRCTSSPYYVSEQPCDVLHIAKLKIFDEYQGQGYGKDFINFFKRESSKRKDCDGRISLVAHHSGRAPHLFYMKQGFITPNINTNKYFEALIKEKKELPFCYYAKDMFLPLKKEHLLDIDVPKLEKQPQGLKEKILGFLKKNV